MIGKPHPPRRDWSAKLARALTPTGWTVCAFLTALIVTLASLPWIEGPLP